MDLVSITNQFDPRIAALLGWVTVLTKVAVDWLKTAMTLPRWAPPFLAFVAALVVLLLLMLAFGVPFSPQLGAQAVLSALISTVLAIGSTALQQRTRPTTPPEEAPAVVGPSVGEIADELLRRQRNERVRDVEMATDAPRRPRPRPPLVEEVR